MITMSYQPITVANGIGGNTALITIFRHNRPKFGVGSFISHLIELGSTDG